MLGRNRWARKQEKQTLLPPKSPKMEQFLRRGNSFLQGMDVALPWDRVRETRVAVGAKSFFTHPDSQDKALISQQAPAALKLLIVLTYSPRCLNWATGHSAQRLWAKPTPCPGCMCVHSGSDQEPAGRGEGNATRAACAQGREALRPGRGVLRVSVGVRSHELLSQGSRNCEHGSDGSRKTAQACNKMYPEFPAWLPLAHSSSSY